MGADDSNAAGPGQFRTEKFKDPGARGTGEVERGGCWKIR